MINFHSSKSICASGIFIMLCLSCATTPRQKVLRDMGIAAVLGYSLGQQKDIDKNSYSTAYAFTGAVIAEVIGLLAYDFHEKENLLLKENEKLKLKLDEALNPILVNSGPGTLSGKIPEKYQSLVNPGEWKIFKTDKWIEEDENVLVHQDKIMQLVPPSLKPK